MRRISAFQITDHISFPFSAKQYSLFKFGSKSIAKLFGKLLFMRFKRWLEENYNGKTIPQIVVCSAPYNHIPTATGAMKDYFVKYINEYLVENGFPVVQESKVHRDTTYREDYGALTKEQRLSLIGRDTFHVDVSFLASKLTIFIDDIYVTGAHQAMMEDMISRYTYDSTLFEHMFLYFAELTNPDIHPSIENELNFASIKSIFDIQDLIHDEDFMFNTRVVKYILNAPDGNAYDFLYVQSDSFLDTLYHLAIGNSYHLVPEYQENLALIKDLLDEKV